MQARGNQKSSSEFPKFNQTKQVLHYNPKSSRIPLQDLHLFKILGHSMKISLEMMIRSERQPQMEFVESESQRRRKKLGVAVMVHILTVCICTGACQRHLIGSAKAAAVGCGSIVAFGHIRQLGDFLEMEKVREFSKRIFEGKGREGKGEASKLTSPHLIIALLLTLLCSWNDKQTNSVVLFSSHLATLFFFVLWQWKANVTVLYKLILAISECLLQCQPESNGAKRCRITAMALPVMDAQSGSTWERGSNYILLIC